MAVCFSSVIFFFQAEDGIRDLYVTGVQTCALPILHTPVTSAPNDLAICTANVPTPPAAPLIKIFCAGSMCPLSRRPWSDGLAILYFRLGERTKALQALEQAYKERQLHMTEIGIEPAF